MHVFQRLDVLVSRQIYFCKIKEMRSRSKGYHAYYQDETWCNDNHTREYIWQLTDVESLVPDVRQQGGLPVPSHGW